MYCMRNPGKLPGFRGLHVDTLSRALKSILSLMCIQASARIQVIYLHSVDYGIDFLYKFNDFQVMLRNAGNLPGFRIHYIDMR